MGLVARALKASEAISTPFAVELELLAPPGTEVPFEKILGKGSSVEMNFGPMKRYFHGIADTLEQEFSEEDDYDHYRVTLVPQLAFCDKTYGSQIFQGKKIPQVLKEILTPALAPMTLHLELTRNYPRHNYCVMYRETLLQFAHRLLEEEGLWYFFRHRRDGHEMVIVDSVGKADAHHRRMSYEPAEGGSRQEGYLRDWEIEQSVATAGYTVRDYHFQCPRQTLEGKGKTPAAVVMGSRSQKLVAVGEVFEPHAGFSHLFDGIDPNGGEQPRELEPMHDYQTLLATTRIQQEVAEAVVAEGRADCLDMNAGTRLHVNGLPESAEDGEYLLTRVEHSARCEAVVTAPPGADEWHYENQFRAVPSGTEYRPPRRVLKPTAGRQTAKVVGVSSNEIFTDKFARVKVQFHWDRQGKNDSKSSCFLRTVQPLAGSSYGFQSLPRVGHEVVVDFLGGDIDQPIIVGSVSNPDQPPPFSLPAQRTRSTLKSHSRNGGSDDFSGFYVEDQSGKEHVMFRSNKDMTISAEQNHYFNTKGTTTRRSGKAFNRQTGGFPFIDHALSTTSSGSGTGPLSTGLAGDAPPSPASGESSGSGAGGESDSSHPGPAQWTTGIFGDMGERLDITLGFKYAFVVGLFEETYMGTHLNTVINPFGFAQAFKMPFAAGVALATVSAPFGGPAAQGNTNAVLGTSTALIYGPQFKIARGPKFEVKGTLRSLTGYPTVKGMSPAIIAACALFSAWTLAQPLLLLVGDGTGATCDLANALGGMVQEMLYGLWGELERAASGTNFYWVSAQKSEATTEVSTSLSSGGIVCAEELIASALLTTQQNMAALGGDYTGAQIEGAGSYSNGDGLFKITADSIHVGSVSSLTSELNGISVMALGKTKIDGTVNITGDAGCGFNAGLNTSIAISAEPNTIVVNHGEVGTTIIKSGDELIPSITISPISIEMLCELGTITFMCAESIVNISPAGVALTCGASSIIITDAGIETTQPIAQVSADAQLDTSASTVSDDSADDNWLFLIDIV